MTSDDLFDRLYRAALEEEKGPGHGVELYERRGAGIEVTEDEDGSRLIEAKERGLALRLFRGGRSAFAAAGPDAAATLLERARLALPRARVRRGARVPSASSEEPRSTGPLADPEVPPEPAVRSLLPAFRRTLAAAGDGTVVLREGSVTAAARCERIATSAGRDARWTSTSASLVALVVGRSPAGRYSARVVATAARPEDLPVARLARHAADRVLLPLTGRPAGAGRTDVLLDPHVAAHLVARLSSLFFGDENAALLAARTRDRRDAFTSPAISLVDDGAAAGGPVQTSRDSEGTPKRRTLLVDRGIECGVLTDVASASRRESPPTGNAIRRTWSEPPTIGVTNLYVDPSVGVSPLDLLSSVSRGVYAAVLLERPDVDLWADRFRIVAAGYAIEKGRATDRLSEIVLLGRLSELLRGVAAIGDDLKFVAGAGGGVGSPTLYVPKWRFV